MAEISSSIWDLADLVYASQYALSATGLSLDAVAELNNLKRIGATSSTAPIIFEGTQGTVVPIGTRVKQNNTSEVLESAAEVTLDVASMLKTLISVNDFATSPHTIDITTDVGTDNFSSVVISSELAVLNDLESQINTLGNHLASVDEGNLTLTITNNLLTDNTVFGIVVDATLDIDEQWSPVGASTINTGSIPIPANSIQQIEDTVAGLNSVDNLSLGIEGVDTETDDDFRLRRKQSIKVVGAATVPAIEARLVAEVLNVTSATVKDNRTDVVDVDGRPPHSLQAIVTGGADQDIFDKIWEVKPAGIETVGTEVGSVIDSTGELQPIRFDRAVPKYLHFDIEITLYDEEIFPADGLAAIKQALVDFGAGLSAGDDVIRQRFFTAIYSVAGVKNITKFECATTVNVSDSTAPIVTETVTAEPTPGTYDLSFATLQTTGIVSGMVVTRTGFPATVTSISSVPLETQFVAEEDVFDSGFILVFGGFGDTDIGIRDNAIAQFDTDNIAIAIV